MDCLPRKDELQMGLGGQASFKGTEYLSCTGSQLVEEQSEVGALRVKISIKSR
ncbi:MAG: hypothetical protein RIS36_1544 [Pseudomonadota bacterium]|jgi:hypothetical protein